jgi:hypothetical protein
MAIHALWDDQYAFSVRKGPLDWTDQTTGGTATDAVSHQDDGDATQHDDGATPPVEFGGDQHFAATRPAVTGSVALGRVIGMPTTTTAVNFGIPVTGNPDFASGVEIIETPVADGQVVGRVGGGSAGNDQSNIFRGGSSPTFSMEFVPTVQSLMLVGSTFFQEGTAQEADKLQLRTVAAGQVSDPMYVASVLRKMSTSAADSRILSDCVANSFSLSADRSTPLTCSADFTGRVLVTDYNASTGAAGSAADTTIDIGRNYALHDCKAAISEGTAATQYVIPVDAFSLNGSMETGYTFYNQTTPQSILTGPQSWEGSITIPLAGRGSQLSNIAMSRILSQLGSNSASPSGTVTPIHISLYWSATPNAGDIGAAITQPTSLAGVRDLHIRLCCVITDISVGGDSEATQTLSFRCLNQMTSVSDVARNAVSIDMKADHASNNMFGFTGASATYGM